MNKNSKIAVLGASGLVGSAIVRKLLEKGYEKVIGTYKSRKPNFEGIQLFQVDLTNQSETETFFAEQAPEYVFLAAAKVGGILANNTYKAEFIYENMAIALNVIHSAYKYGVNKLLNLGSSCIYPKHAPQPLKEEYLLTAPLEPTNEPYAIAKIAAIKLCRYYNEQYGTNFISVMPTNLYGTFDNFNLETSHVLPALIRKFHLAKLLEEGDFEGIKKDFKKHSIGFGLDEKLDLSDNRSVLQILTHLGIKFSNTINNLEHKTSNKVTVTLWGTGKVYREFLHVDDLADTCVFIMENTDAWQLSPHHPKNNLEHRTLNIEHILPDYLINIGIGEDLTIDELAHVIKNIVGFKGEIHYDTSKPDGTPRKLLDVSNIKRLGWSYKIGLKEGLKEVYEWYKEN
ncbi:GDP-L-fucose synthase [Thermodesulfovibrio sp.]|uniref:GDP-L-fucose synthase family protein n=1 Tax=Thermodesulfovibrio sp. TaxID=2067987 RepID=UPI0030AE7911